MNGTQMREYLRPLTFKEKADFLKSVYSEYSKLPPKKQRENDLVELEAMESNPKPTLIEKINIAFDKARIKFNEKLDKLVPITQEEATKKLNKLPKPKSPYFISEMQRIPR